MPVPVNLLVAPIPLAGEIAGAQQALPQAQAQAAREAAFEALVHDRQKTPPVEAQGGLDALHEDGGGQQPGGQRPRPKRPRPGQEPEPAPTHAHAEGPWQGVIINVNV
ncbi:MAG: hypothetical protein LDL27_02425 [Desulfovibrio sp.]|nr:hypothetical protein [Desulfovibrio sp.]